MPRREVTVLVECPECGGQKEDTAPVSLGYRAGDIVEQHHLPGYCLERRPGWWWAQQSGDVILDPDGWRGDDGVGMEVPILYEDYLQRLNISTVQQ